MVAIAFTSVTLLYPDWGFATSASHPCSEITRKCRAIGYGSQNANEQKRNLIKNCLEKVVHGQTLPGVDVPLTTISACQTIYNKSLTARKGLPSDLSENKTKRPSRKIASEGVETEIEPPRYGDAGSEPVTTRSGTH